MKKGDECGDIRMWNEGVMKEKLFWSGVNVDVRDIVVESFYFCPNGEDNEEIYCCKVC